MDAEEIAALTAGLGKAIVDGLSASEAAKVERVAAEKKAKADSGEAKRIAEKRSEALRRVVDSFEREQEGTRSAVMSAVERYCGKAKADVLEPLKKDPRMPRFINYLERYCVLAGMDDRVAVLERLGAMLDLADEILNAVVKVDVQGALDEAADEYMQKVMRLDGIQVGDVDRMPKGGEPGEELPAHVAPTLPEIVQVVEAVFVGALGDLSEVEIQKSGEVEAAKARERAIEEQIDAAVKAASAAAEAVMRSRAESVIGAVLAVRRPAGFGGEVTLKATKDPARVRELAVEVRKSFDTFERVVIDNGLFAAFASEGSYGACKGVSLDCWWDGFFYDEYFGDEPGRKTYEEIPTGIEEDEGGDSLEKSLECLRECNERKYWGLLDEDFVQHVDAFWYGFKKLMENVNGLFELDSRAFDKYCSQISQAVQNSAGKLGECMDVSQMIAFCKEIDDRAKVE